MIIDIRTLIFILGFTHLMQVLVFFHQYRVNKTYNGLGWWLLWSAAETIGFSAILFRQIVWMLPFIIIVQNSMIVAGSIFLYIGTKRFFNKPINTKLIISVFSIFICGLLYFLFINENIQIRSIFIATTLAIVAFITTHSFYKDCPRSISVGGNFLASIFLIHGVFFVYRLIALLAGVTTEHFLDQTLFNILPFVDALLVSIVGTFGLIILVNQRLNTELTENKNELLLIFNTSPDAAIITRLTDGYITEINDSFTTITGYTRADVIGKSSIEINVWKNIEDRQKITNILREKGYCENYEAQFVLKDGTEITGLMSAKIINIHRVQNIISITRNITERKITAKLLLEKNSEIETKNIELNKAKEKAEEDKERFDFVLQGSNLGFWDWNIETNEVIRNKRWAEILEYTLEEIEFNVKQWTDLIYPEDREKALTSLNNHLSGKTPYHQVEYRMIAKGGQLKWILDSAKIVKSDENGKPLRMSGTHKDITERKIAEEALLKSEARMVSAIEAAGLFLYEEEGENNANRRMSFLDANMRNLLDIPKEQDERARDYWIEHIHPDDLQNIMIPEIQKFEIEGHNMVSAEYRYLHSKRGTIWFRHAAHALKRNPEGKILHLVGAVQDITERKQAEILLRESRELLIYAINKSPLMMTQSDLTTGKYIEVNDSFCSVSEFTREEIIGKSAIELGWISKDERMRMIQKVQDDGWVNELELALRTKNGKNIIGRYWGTIIHTTKGDILFSTSEDITERKLAEEEIIIAKEKAEESDRLKTAFLQNISHEIRTPLTAICGFSGMLNKPDITDEKRDSFVSIIRNSSNQLLSIVTDILTISSLETKQEKTNIQKVEINTIIIELLSVFNHQANNQNVSLYSKKELTDEESIIYTDKTKIIQILTNLISNALKFTHKGFIEFGYNIVETHGRASLHELQFYVKDTGIGIKPELHEKIFERFRQADLSISKNYGGTGLGLSISRGFVDLLGGKIWVESEVEVGSTFYFTIPYYPVNEINNTIALTKKSKTNRTILIAEDEEYNFLFIEELLSGLNLKLIHAKNGLEAVEICKSNAKIDLIVMDIKMPIMDGHEAAKLINEFRPELPIIALSAYALEHERAKYEGRFDDYITKPINENDLKQKVLSYITIKKE